MANHSKRPREETGEVGFVRWLNQQPNAVKEHYFGLMDELNAAKRELALVKEEKKLLEGGDMFTDCGGLWHFRRVILRCPSS